MATFSVRIDDQTKSAFDKFCDASGLTLSGAINIFMKAVVKENKIPFEITGSHEPSEQFLAAIKEAEEISSNQNAKGFNSVEDLFKDLNS